MFAIIYQCFFNLHDCTFKLKSNSVIKQKKFHTLLKGKRSTQDPEKVIFNFSKYVLLKGEKSLLTKSLNFSIRCKKLDYVDYLVNFELVFRDIHNLDICLMKIWILLKQKLRKRHYHVIELI